MSVTNKSMLPMIRSNSKWAIYIRHNQQDWFLNKHVAVSAQDNVQDKGFWKEEKWGLNSELVTILFLILVLKKYFCKTLKLNQKLKWRKRWEKYIANSVKSTLYAFKNFWFWILWTKHFSSNQQSLTLFLSKFIF